MEGFYSIIQSLFGTVAENKVRIVFSRMEKTPIVREIISMFFARVTILCDKNRSVGVKTYFAIAPVLNIFLFAGFRPFIIIIFSDVYFVSYLATRSKKA